MNEAQTKAQRLLRMDNIGIVVESLDDAIQFFTELGLNLEGRATIDANGQAVLPGWEIKPLKLP